MNKIRSNLILACVILILSTVEAKGGGGGGRGGGRGGSRGGSWSSSRGSSSSSSSSWGGSRTSFSSSGSPSSFGGSSAFSGVHTAHPNNGGWFHGFFQATPYHYAPRPVYISRTINSPNKEDARSYNHDTEKSTDKPDNAPITDTHSFAVGLAINKALSNDLFSIFNMANDISEYLEDIKRPITPTTSTTTTSTDILARDTTTPIIETTTIPTATTTTSTAEETLKSIYDLDPYKLTLDSIAKGDSNLEEMMGIINSLTIVESYIPEYHSSSSEIN